MATKSHRTASESVSATADQREDLRALAVVLASTAHRKGSRAARCKLEGPGGEKHVLPDAVVSILGQVIELLTQGDSVSVVPVGQELTTQEAADLLSVSRQYLVRLLDDGQIPHTKTGKHRRVRYGDVLAFKHHRDSQRTKTLDKLAQLSQDLGGYDELR